MDDAELEVLLTDVESDRVERKERWAGDAPEKVREAVCAFANDLPGSGLPGVVFIGARDDGSPSGCAIDDQLLLTLSDTKSDGSILPPPSITVRKRVLLGSEFAVVEVMPSDWPPVRYKGRVCVRVGPRRGYATEEEESRLAERRRAKDLPYELCPAALATLDDLDLGLFEREYLPCAVAPEVLAANQRSPEQQLASLRFVLSTVDPRPTVLGVLTLGKDPPRHIPGAYVQFVRFDGPTLSDPIRAQAEVSGPMSQMLRVLDELLEAHVSVAVDLASGRTEARAPDYPISALRQIARNAVLHRTYDRSNAPVRISWFADHVEIISPGGPYGVVTRDNFGTPGVTDYRNPNLARVMRDLGYVQRFGVGIEEARRALRGNGNPELEFQVEDTFVAAVLRCRE